MTGIEATRTRRRTNRSSRKPFSDCTNTVDSVNQSQSSSTSTKNSSSPSFIKPSNLLNSNTTKTFVPTNSIKTPTTGSSAVFSGKGDNSPSNPSGVLVPSVSTPSRMPNPFSPQGTASPTVPELSSVYGRRQSADKRKRKGKEIAVSMSCFPAVKTHLNRNEMNEVGVTGLSRSCMAPNKKKRPWTTSKEDVANHVLQQDFIEQQRKYFAEVDAYELSEEEVASIDELD